MRKEQEVYQLILNIARKDPRILAVYMNGSRTNPNAVRDIFQDYDIVYVVENTSDFINDKEWIYNFGNILYMQYPDEFPDCPCDKDNFYGWLMQFTDGIRIDLHVESVSHALEYFQKGKLYKILLDKKQLFPEMATATDEQYWIKRPTKEQYLACCNEFWWCSNNIAKGLWIEDYSQYLATYFGGNISEAWKAIHTMTALFERTAVWVAEHLGYSYNAAEGNAAKEFLHHVEKLPKDATDIY